MPKVPQEARAKGSSGGSCQSFPPNFPAKEVQMEHLRPGWARAGPENHYWSGGVPLPHGISFGLSCRPAARRRRAPPRQPGPPGRRGPAARRRGTVELIASSRLIDDSTSRRPWPVAMELFFILFLRAGQKGK